MAIKQAQESTCLTRVKVVLATRTRSTALASLAFVILIVLSGNEILEAAQPRSTADDLSVARASASPAPQTEPLPSGALLRLGTARYRQDGPIWTIAYSPDGRFVVGCPGR
jgi:hypothetical protein